MAGVQTSPQPSSSTSAAFVDAEDIWRSAAPSISSSSRNSVAVIPPHFPPPRGFNRLVEILRSKIPSLLKNRSKDIYRDYSVPGVLAAKPHVSYHNQPPPSLPAHINVSFSTVPKSDSSSPRRLPRPRHRTRRSRRTVAQSSTSGQSFSANISPHDINLPPSPVVSKRPPSSLRGRSSSRRTGAGIATVGVNPQKLTINTSSMAAPGKPCLCLPSEPVGVGAEPHTEDSKARLQSTERFRVFSLGGELAYVDAGRPYEETLRLAQRAYPPLQNVPPDRIQFFLPCGVAERARVPEDAWQGMIRRTGSLDRVYIHVRPEEASEEGNTVAVAGDISGREDSGEQASDGDSVS